MKIPSPSIIFENDDMFVVNKPYGMVVNRADTTRHMVTLQDWIEEKFKTSPKGTSYFVAANDSKLKVEEESDFYKRAGIVHRIDKETSGALLIAKNEEAFAALQLQFKEKTVDKMYVALCHGAVTPLEGTIDVPVGRLPWNRKKFGVIAEGRQSVTKYRVEKTFVSPQKETLSLVYAYPQTGRTHQIRVHMRYLNYPIFGDLLYAGRKNARRDRMYLERHFLHAAKISFTNPRDKKRITVEAPLPSELVDFLALLH